jgi:hypothetical protein
MSTQDQIQKRLEFLQSQIDHLDHYLPKTYQFLMDEMDAQQRILIEMKVQSYYQEEMSEISYHETDA